MKKKKSITLLLVLLLTLLFSHNSVLAIENAGTSGEPGNVANIGSGAWNDYAVGLKICIVKADGTLNKCKIILNECGNNCKYSNKFSTDLNPKFLQENPNSWKEEKYPTSNIITSNIIPSRWKNNSIVINFNALLTGEGYKKLKELINLANLSYSGNDWIFVEPMTAIGAYYGTAYELAKSFLEKSNCNTGNSFCWLYRGAVFGGSNKYPNGGIFYTAIYLYKDVATGFKTFSKRTEGDFNERSNCFTKQLCGAGIGIYRVSDVYPELQKGKLIIEVRKYDPEHNSPLITGKTTYIKVGNNIYNTGNSGSINRDLDAGSYNFSIDQGPADYNYRSGLVSSVKIESNKTTKVVIYYDATCRSDLTEISHTPANLSNLYTKWKLRGLLNFGKPSCSDVTCNYSKNISCLSGNFGSVTFNQNNVSCFNEEKDVNGSKMYCLVSFNLVNKLGVTNFFATSGQMPISKETLDNAMAATGTVSKKCLVIGSSTPNDANIGRYSDYVTNVSFGGENLFVKSHDDISESDKVLKQVNKSGNWYEYSFSVDYYLSDVYATNIKGEIYYGNGDTSKRPCTNCKFLGYGIIGKFSDKGEMNIPFSIAFTNEIKDFEYEDKNYTNQCKVTLTPELITKNDKLNLEFRLIDTSNPFPGKSGNGRIVGSNWCSGTDCQSDNELITNIILNRPNSYGKVPSTNEIKNPIYEITLTPDIIKSIREYNQNNSYDDYTLKCDSYGNNCKSTFLEKYGIAKLS